MGVVRQTRTCIEHNASLWISTSRNTLIDYNYAEFIRIDIGRELSVLFFALSGIKN